MEKKPSPVKRRIIKNIAYRRYKRRLYSKHKAKNRNSQCFSQPIKITNKSEEGNVFKFPEIVDIYNTDRASKLLDLLSKIENHAFVEEKNCVLSFRQTKAISLSGGIILKAFHDKLKFSGHTLKIKILDSNQKTKQVLNHIGLLNDDSIKITYKDISCWEIKTWRREEREKSNAASELYKILNALTNWSSENNEYQYILTALSEAIWNSFEHAYYGFSNDKFQHTYLFSGIHDDSYTFCIFDRGIGFKGSFKRYNPSLYNRLASEKKIIQNALIYGRSGAAGRGRGSGLPDVINNIKHLGGSVSIYSNKAFYNRDATNEEENERRSDLNGALVQVSVPRTKVDSPQ